MKIMRIKVRRIFRAPSFKALKITLAVILKNLLKA